MCVSFRTKLPYKVLEDTAKQVEYVCLEQSAPMASHLLTQAGSLHNLRQNRLEESFGPWHWNNQLPCCVS